jgi:hypothetical protein
MGAQQPRRHRRRTHRRELAASQKATGPTKPESLSGADLKAQWRADARGLTLDRDAHLAARTDRRTRARSAHGAARTADIAAAFL